MQKSPNIFIFDWYSSPLTHHFTQPLQYRSQSQVTSSEMVRAPIGANVWNRKGERKEESFRPHGISSKRFPSDRRVSTVTLSRVSSCSHQGFGRDQEHTHHDDGKKLCSLLSYVLQGPLGQLPAIWNPPTDFQTSVKENLCMSSSFFCTKIFHQESQGLYVRCRQWFWFWAKPKQWKQLLA